MDLSNRKVFFSEGSTIMFLDMDDNLIFQMDPTELSAIYGAYRIMEREMLEDEKWLANQRRPKINHE